MRRLSSAATAAAVAALALVCTPVAAAAEARVPTGITQRLVENAIAAANDSFRVRRVRDSEAGSKALVVDAFRIWLAEACGIAATRNVSGEHQGAGPATGFRVRQVRIDEGPVVVFLPSRGRKVPPDTQVERQLWCHFPVVIDMNGDVFLTDVLGGQCRVIQARGSYVPQQKTGEPIAAWKPAQAGIQG